MISQHSNSLATATAAISLLVNLLRLCTKMAAISLAKGCMQTLFCSVKRKISECLHVMYAYIIHRKKDAGWSTGIYRSYGENMHALS